MSEIIHEILSGKREISKNIKDIMTGVVYTDDEFNLYVSSLLEIMDESHKLKQFIFFDYLEKDEKHKFAADHLGLRGLRSPLLSNAKRIEISPKYLDTMEFLKKDFYAEGVSTLYSYFYPMHRISEEDFIAVWSIAISNGVFSEMLKKFNKKEEKITPLRRRKKRR